MPRHVNATLHRSTRTKYSWHIGPHSCQNHSWCNLVTVGNIENTVKPVGVDDRFSSICDQLARWQTITHPDMAHRNPIIDTDGVKFKRDPTSLADSFLGNIR